MNALPSPRPTSQPPRTRRRVGSQSNQQRQQKQHRVVALETSLKLAVNGVLSAVAIVALIRMAPKISAQQAKLAEVQAEVKTTQVRVGRVSEDFNRYFDPRQAQAIMREQSDMIDPKQRTVVFDEPAKPSAVKSAQLPNE
jgi:hypothetical protein